jgi:hypothetical protein
MEEALSEGLPLRGEVQLLRKSLEGIDKDTLLSLALSSLPEEALDCGTDTQMDLSIKAHLFTIYCAVNLQGFFLTLVSSFNSLMH